MHPFRPAPKSTPFDLPIWLRKTIGTAATFVGVLLVVATMSGVAVGCGRPLFPTLSAIEQTVANDLAAGKTDAQIASDVCADLGGSSTTDAACADVEEIIQTAITLLIDTHVLTGKALGNARGYQARHSAAAK